MVKEKWPRMPLGENVVGKGKKPKPKKGPENLSDEEEEYTGIGVSPGNKREMVRHAAAIVKFVKEEFRGKFITLHEDKVEAKKRYGSMDEFQLLNVARNSDEEQWRREPGIYLELAKFLIKKASEKPVPETPDSID